MKRAVVGLCALALAGCAAAPKDWIRPDGQPINNAQLLLDKTACEGEVEKATMADPDKRIPIVLPGQESQRTRVLKGCMASRGYVAATGN
jgi:hypothetical protein